VEKSFKNGFRLDLSDAGMNRGRPKLKTYFCTIMFLILLKNQLLSATLANDSLQRIVLVYIDKYNNMTISDYKVLLSYYNGSTINDTFFNTFLFLGQFSNSGESYEGYEKGSSYASWMWWLSKIFGKDGQMEILNNATEEVSKQTTLKEVSVIVMIPRPLTNLTLEERYENVKAYVAKTIQLFNEGNYNKLKLIGFYWMCETVSSQDYNLVKEVSRLVHSLGLKFYWIPYFGAEGVDKWQELGFDYVMLQPNFAFSNVDTNRFSTVNEITKKLNISIEMELATFVYNPRVTWQESFILYMYYSSLYNWQDLPVLSYFNGNQFSQNLFKDYRTYYDLVYMHVKGKDLRNSKMVADGYNAYITKVTLSNLFSMLILFALFVAIAFLLFVKLKLKVPKLSILSLR
jgi:hypothetical protein